MNPSAENQLLSNTSLGRYIVSEWTWLSNPRHNSCRKVALPVAVMNVGWTEFIVGWGQRKNLAINHGTEFVRDLGAKEPQIRKMDRPMENGKR